MSHKKIPVISLFSGAMGLDLGLEQAGFEVVLAVECDAQAIATIKLNRPSLTVIERKIEEVSTTEILTAAGLKRGGAFVVSGGPSCQSFSTAGQRRSLADPRGGLFRHFTRIVREARPKFFIMENVKGMLSAAIMHRPLDQRGPGFPPLAPEEELGSAFRVIVDELRDLQYYTVFDVLNSANYGTPQRRERILFIGSRDGKRIAMPKHSHSETPSKVLKKWVSLREAIGEIIETNSVGIQFSERTKQYLQYIPQGGNWRDLPTELKIKALGGAFHSWGGRSGFYRRLAWDKPSPALTTQPDSKATMLCHPSENRPLSIKEYAQIQQFPSNWKFVGSIISQYRQIGNAVPISLGTALGTAVQASWNKRNQPTLLGKVETFNNDLILKMSKRPVTILNPPHIRKARSAIVELNADWSQLQKRKRLTDQYVANETNCCSID